MKRVDFENGTVTGNILGAALPMLVAQILNLLYNIVDRVYIAHVSGGGNEALGAVGICFPLIVIITAFANLLEAEECTAFLFPEGKSRGEKPCAIMNTCFSMVCVSGVILMVTGYYLPRPILILFWSF